MQHKIKVIIAEGHAMVSEAFTQLLNRDPHIVVVGHANTGEDLLKLLRKKEHDVLIYSLEPPIVDSSETLCQVRQKFPGTRVIILTAYFNLQVMDHHMANGVRAYLPKECSFDVLLDAVYTVPLQKYYHPDLRGVLPNLYKVYFTETETIILKWICRGKTNREIAELVSSATNTIAWHRKNIYDKARVNCSALLALFAVQNGIISIHEAQLLEEKTYKS